MCKCVVIYIFFLFGWMVYELLLMNHLSPFLGCGLSFSIIFLTCLVSMWHTFFGYASFFLLVTCFVSMWHTFFGYASFISFCIAHIPVGNFGEKVGHGMNCRFILWWMKMFAIFQCRSIACECTCT